MLTVAGEAVAYVQGLPKGHGALSQGFFYLPGLHRGKIMGSRFDSRFSKFVDRMMVSRLRWWTVWPYVQIETWWICRKIRRLS